MVLPAPTKVPLLALAATLLAMAAATAPCVASTKSSGGRGLTAGWTISAADAAAFLAAATATAPDAASTRSCSSCNSFCCSSDTDVSATTFWSCSDLIFASSSLLPASTFASSASRLRFVSCSVFIFLTTSACLSVFSLSCRRNASLWLRTSWSSACNLLACASDSEMRFMTVSCLASNLHLSANSLSSVARSSCASSWLWRLSPSVVPLGDTAAMRSNDATQKSKESLWERPPPSGVRLGSPQPFGVA
mmetsp:Transcript_48248/g.134688  ORF Transcript_48248/g.134688 Transcript_48248/m.134688 type:complete len:249 (+) Transcript_48248:1143-1889(+)